jgi:hypothetical protein
MTEFCGVCDPFQLEEKDMLHKPYLRGDDTTNPFFIYETANYQWPNLHNEIDEMLETVVVTYLLAALRRKARSHELEESAGRIVLKLPITHSEAMVHVLTNRDRLLENEAYKQVLLAAEERNMLPPFNTSEQKRPTNVSRASIVAFDDDFGNDGLVYTIGVNPVRKLITVCFHGLATDGATDFTSYTKEVQNPIKNRSQKATFRLVQTFHDYLFEASSRGSIGRKGEGEVSEYEAILRILIPATRRFPNYKVYVTGHGIGAALATLFGFRVATEPDSVIPKPVSIFSIGGPYVGDASFRSAHQTLESQGKLRHARFTNQKDMLTIAPKLALGWKLNYSSFGTLFKHVGMHVRLSPLEVSYPKVRSGYFARAWDEAARGWEQSLTKNISFSPFHTLLDYSRRFEANKPVLQSIRLNELYSRKSIVGNLLAEF